MEKLTSYERVIRTFNHQEGDRIPRNDSFWWDTIESWKQQGCSSEDEIVNRYEFDVRCGGWVNHMAKIQPNITVDENDRWITQIDGNGAVLRFFKGKMGTPEHVSFTIQTREDWEKIKGDLLATPVEERVNLQETLATMEAARAAKRWFGWNGVECFECAKDVVGHETLCCAMVEDPDWARDIFETQTTVSLNVINYLVESGVQYDGAFMYGDIAYNKGPFCSPKMYKNLVMPSHARHVGWFKERGLNVIYHTDGDFRPLIPSFLEVGIDCFQPLEAKANMDVRELKPLYGDRVSFMGNIDAMVLNSNDRDLIEAEVASKIPIAKVNGGYFYHSDHSVPPGVTWETYQFLMERVEYYGKY